MVDSLVFLCGEIVASGEVIGGVGGVLGRSDVRGGVEGREECDGDGGGSIV